MPLFAIMVLDSGHSRHNVRDLLFFILENEETFTRTYEQVCFPSTRQMPCGFILRGGCLFLEFSTG